MSREFTNFTTYNLAEIQDARLVFDTETDGLLDEVTQFWCGAFIDIDTDKSWFVRPENIVLLPKIFEKAKLLVGHNAIGFDVPALEKVFKVKVARSKIRDTLVYSRLANSARSIPPGAKSAHSIESWAIRFGLMKKVHEDWTKFSEDMKQRCETDTVVGWLTLKAVLKELRHFGKDSLEGETALAWILSDMKEDGFYLDQEKAMNLYMETKELADKLEREIRNVFPPLPSPIKEFNPKQTSKGLWSVAQIKQLQEFADRYNQDLQETVGGPYTTFEYSEFNLDSPKQRVERLLACGWQPQSYTKPSESHPNGQPRFDADELTPELLAELPSEVRLLGTYLMCRSRQRTASQWLDLVDSNSYVHGQVIGTGASTGRMAHRSPNLGNIPKPTVDKATKLPIKGVDGFFGYECRDAWSADPRVKDQVIFDADLTAIQLRAFAHYVDDPEYTALVSDTSIDMHEVHANLLGGVSRDLAKTWLYSFFFGAGMDKLGKTLGGGRNEGIEAFNNFNDRIPGIGRLKGKGGLTDKWAHQGWMTALDGRMVPVFSRHLALASALQSFEKIVISYTVIGMDNWKKDKKINDLVLRMIVHDEAVYTVNKKNVDICGKQFIDFVRLTGERFGSRCPLTAAYGSGKTWSSGH